MVIQRSDEEGPWLERFLFQEVYINQGLLLILILAMFVFISNNIYLKFTEYALIISYLFIWITKQIRGQDGYGKQEI